MSLNFSSLPFFLLFFFFGNIHCVAVSELPNEQVEVRGRLQMANEDFHCYLLQLLPSSCIVFVILMYELYNKRIT